MIKRIGQLISIILLLTVSLIIGSCDRHGAAWDKLDMAESLMNARPDSALAVLESIPASDIKGKETSARYALLMSQALDKNYIDTTDFKVLQPAIDYYPDNGTPDEKLKTYYYQGCIYQNKGDDDNAMLSYINAREIKNVTDSLVLAHLFVAQGTLYLTQYKTSNFVANNINAAKLYGSFGKHIMEIKSYANALSGAIMLTDKYKADSIKNICLELTAS